MLFNDCFFFLDNIGVNAMYITVKIKHNKIDKGGEGEEGGFKPQAIMFWKVKLALNIKPVSMHFLKTLCPQ